MKTLRKVKDFVRRNVGKIAVGGAITLASFLPSFADEPKTSLPTPTPTPSAQVSDYNVRLRQEYTDKEDDFSARTTLGVGKGEEFFRAYQDTTQSSDLTSVSFQVPFKTNDLENSVNIYGMTGNNRGNDIRNLWGVGLNYTIKAGNLSLNLVGEIAEQNKTIYTEIMPEPTPTPEPEPSPELSPTPSTPKERVWNFLKQKATERIAARKAAAEPTPTPEIIEEQVRERSTRLGIGLDYQLNDKVLVGVGLDRVNNPDTTNYFSGKTVIDLTDRDQVGIGFRHQDGEQDVNSVSGFWCHYNDSWGHRTWLLYDKSKDLRGITFDSIWAQNPTFSAGSSPWIVGRGLGDMYDVGIVQNALGAERVPLGMRTRGGLVGELKVVDGEDGEINYGFVRGDLGYKFNVHGLQPTLTSFYRRDTGDEKGRSYGGSLLLPFAKYFCGEVGVSAGDLKETYVSVGFSCPIGNGR